jgi:NTE family protein
VDERPRNSADSTLAETPEKGASGTPSTTVGSLGSRPWWVLGGGGLKGLAHIGAWQALTEAGLEPAGIIGTSIGALVGALIAAGESPERVRDAAHELRRTDIVRLNRRVAWINGVRQVSVFRGEVLRDYYERLLPEGGWDALRIPLQMNAVDLDTGHSEWFGSGARTDIPLVDAAYASSALPVFYPPLMLDNRAYVDGGTEHPLALHRAAELGATGIVGIDVGVGERAQAGRILAEGLLGVHARIYSIMTYRRRREMVEGWRGPPLLYVRPRLDGFEAFDFDGVEYFIDEGYRATKEALERLT